MCFIGLANDCCSEFSSPLGAGGFYVSAQSGSEVASPRLSNGQSSDSSSKEKESMMWFHMREVAGWLLVVAALSLLWMAVGFLKNPETPHTADAAVAVFGGLGVLRMGILLIRISTAARIVLASGSREKTKGVDC